MLKRKFRNLESFIIFILRILLNFKSVWFEYNLTDHLTNDPIPLPILEFFDFREIGKFGFKKIQAFFLKNLYLIFFLALTLRLIIRFINLFSLLQYINSNVIGLLAKILV